MAGNDALDKAAAHFKKLVEGQIARAEKMKKAAKPVDFAKLDVIRIGYAGGDGIGPYITKPAAEVMKKLLSKQVKAGKVEIVEIDGLTIENRFKVKKAIPDDVLAALKKCHLILKGPTETPQKGDPRGNIESANVSMRRELDLYANCRPVKVAEEGIDWMFFRENTEGAYVLGSQGIMANEDVAFDFCVATRQGTERICRAGFEYAKKVGAKRVTVVTKANVVKTTDGMFSEIFHRMAKDYPGIAVDEYYIDIMTAKLIEVGRRQEFQVFVLPNLYGDILTDEAAQIQGGVGTAGSANIGDQYAMFEAIHGSGNRMVAEGRAEYANPVSVMRAAALLLKHGGFKAEGEKLDLALDVAAIEKKVEATGKKTGATAAAFSDYLMDLVGAKDLEKRAKAKPAKAS